MYGHDAQAYQLSCGIVRQIFCGLPTRDAEMIVKARAEILVVDHVKALCKELGLQVSPAVMQQIEASPLTPLPEALRFPSVEDMQERQAAAPVTEPVTTEAPAAKRMHEEKEIEEVVVKQELEDVKPPLAKRLATSYLGQPD